MLLMLAGVMYGQRTTKRSLPLFNAFNTLTAGSLSDDGITNAGLNSISLRTELWFNNYFSRLTAGKDTLHGIGIIRAFNNTAIDMLSSGVTNFTNSTFQITPNGQFGLSLFPYGVSAGNTSSLIFRELVANGSNYVGLKAPDALSGNQIWTLPPADGAANTVLSTNGSGVLSFQSISAVLDTTNIARKTQQNLFTVDQYLGVAAALRFNSYQAGKIYFKPTNKAYIEMEGMGSDTNKLYMTVWDSGYGRQHFAQMRVVSRYGTRTLSKISVEGNGGVYLGGRRSADSTTSLNDFYSAFYDSSTWTVGGVRTMHLGSTGLTLLNSTSLFFNDGTYTGYLVPNTQSASHFWKLPDTSGTIALKADIGERITPYAFYVGAVDSFWVFNVPQNATLDSIQVKRSGLSAATVTAYRDRGGSVAYLLSSAYTVTTSFTTVSGLQNTSLQKNDEIYVVLRSFSGTIKELPVQFYWH